MFCIFRVEREVDIDRWFGKTLKPFLSVKVKIIPITISKVWVNQSILNKMWKNVISLVFVVKIWIRRSLKSKQAYKYS